MGQVAVDLLTGPGRNPSEAVALLDWMAANERAWRAVTCSSPPVRPCSTRSRRRSTSATRSCASAPKRSICTRAPPRSRNDQEQRPRRGLERSERRPAARDTNGRRGPARRPSLKSVALPRRQDNRVATLLDAIWPKLAGDGRAEIAWPLTSGTVGSSDLGLSVRPDSAACRSSKERWRQPERSRRHSTDALADRRLEADTQRMG